MEQRYNFRTRKNDVQDQSNTAAKQNTKSPKKPAPKKSALKKTAPTKAPSTKKAPKKICARRASVAVDDRENKYETYLNIHEIHTFSYY